MQKLTIDTKWYNEKRDGKPYVAVCNEEARVVRWGLWIGTPGNAGELSIDIPETPTLVLKGQKDHRVAKYSNMRFAVFSGNVQLSGWVSDKLTAVKYLRGFSKRETESVTSV